METFNGWTIGTTSNGTWGEGYPVVTGWPLGGLNAAKGEVGEVSFDGTLQGGTLSQVFNTTGGAATLSFIGLRWVMASTPTPTAAISD